MFYQVNENDSSQLARATAQDEIIIYSAVRKDLRISVISSLDINFVGTLTFNESKQTSTVRS